jgi:hypothetical protein
MCITGDAVQVVSVTVVAVSVVTVTVPMVTVPGFEWPAQTHATIFSLPDLKSKPGVPGCGGLRLG